MKYSKGWKFYQKRKRQRGLNEARIIIKHLQDVR